MKNILIIIPARGGSKGIPRKNLRILNGHPLIYYVIKTCLNSKYNPDVYVTSDDEEILTIAKKFGAKLHKRSPQLSNRKTPLDPVIIKAHKDISDTTAKKYNIVITVQPTSPLLTQKTLDDAISTYINFNEVDTIISATDDTHLTWSMQNGKVKPNYKKRINRQELTPVFRETGAFLISDPELFNQGSRIGHKVKLYTVPPQEKIDVDNFEDWSICEYYLQRKKILFVITGYQQVGLGHVYNALSIADEILEHQVSFLVDDKSQMAFDTIQKANHTVYIQKEYDILDDIIKLNPNVIINDRLDTDRNYIVSLKKQFKTIINFEDLGDGAIEADLVINAMYPEKAKTKNHFFGFDYFVLRNEFQFSAPVSQTNSEIKQVLLTFGGIDINNLTRKVLDSIYEFCLQNNIQINVVLGLGYNQKDTLNKFQHIDIKSNVGNLSELVESTDICFTSAGRTTFEIASIGIPTIVLCQNIRESTHFFAKEEFGFINLGIGNDVSREVILRSFQNLCNDHIKRNEMYKSMINTNLRKGKQNVISLIRKNIK